MATQTNNNKNFIGIIVMGVIVILLLFVIFALAMTNVLKEDTLKYLIGAIIAAVATYFTFSKKH